MRLIMVGGVFNQLGGRASGYFTKLSNAIAELLNHNADYAIFNGGPVSMLETLSDTVKGATHLLWFADVPNDIPKLLPQIKDLNPSLFLIQSKNNRSKKYTREQLHQRLIDSRSSLLVEFGESEDGRLVASIMNDTGEVILESSANIAHVAICIVNHIK